MSDALFDDENKSFSINVFRWNEWTKFCFFYCILTIIFDIIIWMHCVSQKLSLWKILKFDLWIIHYLVQWCVTLNTFLELLHSIESSPNNHQIYCIPLSHYLSIFVTYLSLLLHFDKVCFINNYNLQLNFKIVNTIRLTIKKKFLKIIFLNKSVQSIWNRKS